MSEKEKNSNGSESENTIELAEEMQNQDAEQPEATAAGERERAPGAGETNHEELTLLLEDARAKADEHYSQLLRTQAEMENLRKRSARDLENAHKFALEKFMNELLPVRDSLELGLAAAVENGQADPEKLKEGVELTLKMFADAMTKFGARQVDPQGERFNPELHQAMSMQEAPDHEPNTVLTVVQKGYQLNDRLIRPALVIVSSGGRRQQQGGGNEYSGGGNDRSGGNIDEQA